MQTLVQICEALGAILGGCGVFYSRRAARLSEPTGDGFASTVLASLNTINLRLTNLEHWQHEQTQSDRPSPGQQEPPRR